MPFEIKYSPITKSTNPKIEVKVCESENSSSQINRHKPEIKAVYFIEAVGIWYISYIKNKTFRWNMFNLIHLFY